MTLQASGAISFSDINTELGLSSTSQISMNDAAVRTLFSQASGAISMTAGYGKSNTSTPGAPTGVSASASTYSSASVSFSAPACNGHLTIDYYQAISSPGCFTATGTSPISVTGLSGSTSYTFRVRAHNSKGYGCYSSSSGSITTPANVRAMCISTCGANVITCNHCSKYKLASFLGTGSFTVNSLSNGLTNGNKIAYMVAAGGGGGGAVPYGGGGGGGGGGIHFAGYTLASPWDISTGFCATVRSYSVSVGGGGSGRLGSVSSGGSGGPGGCGTATYISCIYSVCGGGGGGPLNYRYAPTNYAGLPGGSGGGGGGPGYPAGAGGSGISGQGNNGGSGGSVFDCCGGICNNGGGGGGSNEVGFSGYGCGMGGAGTGVQNWSSGVSCWTAFGISRANLLFGAGGGAGFQSFSYNSNMGVGGSGIGGRGGKKVQGGTYMLATSAVASSGSGGGGNLGIGPDTYSGSGSGGGVIIRWRYAV